MQNSPVIVLALLQVVVILTGCAVSHRIHGEYVWLLLALPVAWTGLVVWLQNCSNQFWTNGFVLYGSGGLLLVGSIHYLWVGEILFYFTSPITLSPFRITNGMIKICHPELVEGSASER